jgi:DNA-binding NarL/FixJ family response regulator
MPKCILLVDDVPAIRSSLRKFFESETEFEVCGEASDGLEAIDKALELHPDLIILDLSMPRMGGIDAARELKRKLPSVPLILFTMHAGATDPAAAAEAGFEAVISKTEDLAILAEKVQNLLEPVG